MDEIRGKRRLSRPPYSPLERLKVFLFIILFIWWHSFILSSFFPKRVEAWYKRQLKKMKSTCLNCRGGGVVGDECWNWRVEPARCGRQGVWRQAGPTWWNRPKNGRAGIAAAADWSGGQVVWQAAVWFEQLTCRFRWKLLIRLLHR